MNVLQSAFFLPVEGGECFCVYRRPTDGPVASTILHLPAFGDEMNKSRAMTARAARAFASRGCGVLQIDLIGCGDSSGDHACATLSRWRDNALRAIDWLRNEHPTVRQPYLWCLRAGALLLRGPLDHVASNTALLLWQPMLSGAQQLSQLLRQKNAGSLVVSGTERAGSKALRERLRLGETLEIGGYAISPRMADELEAANLDIVPGPCGEVAWLELAATSQPVIAPASQAKIQQLATAGVRISAKALQGPGFWQSVEIEYCEPLIDVSLDMLSLERADAVPRDTVVL